MAAIKQLCDIDPAKAKNAIVEFSNYLRGNLDALTMKENIPFEKELDQVESYISLEKNRFGDVLKVSYDIKTRNFKIPPLTLQTIVENAVRHGITKKAGGGTVEISSWETEEEYVVSVSDDGVGIDTAYLADGKNHVGMENVRRRLETLCGGHMEVASRLGAGTRVTIMIPKGEVQHEIDCGGCVFHLCQRVSDETDESLQGFGGHGTSEESHCVGGADGAEDTDVWKL